MTAPEDRLPEPLASWSQDLAGEVITPLAPEGSRTIAAHAAAMAASGSAAGAVAVGAHLVVKLFAAAALTAVVGGGLAAATGVLPDPIQRWVADLVDGVGIHLPRPEPSEVTIPDVTTPEMNLPDVTVPGVTIPTVIP